MVIRRSRTFVAALAFILALVWCQATTSAQIPAVADSAGYVAQESFGKVGIAYSCNNVVVAISILSDEGVIEYAATQFLSQADYAFEAIENPHPGGEPVDGSAWFAADMGVSYKDGLSYYGVAGVVLVGNWLYIGFVISPTFDYSATALANIMDATISEGAPLPGGSCAPTESLVESVLGFDVESA